MDTPVESTVDDAGMSPEQSRHKVEPAQGKRYSPAQRRDNAPSESFFHTLKTELTHHQRYRTREDAKQDIFEYIEVFYNRQRPHSTIG